MRTRLLLLALGCLPSLAAPAQTEATPTTAPSLAFLSDGTNGFTFDTGLLRGRLRAGGRSQGVSQVFHVPTGLRLDGSMGLFSHYRVFSAGQRYGTAAWDWSSEASLRPDGSVE